MSKVRMKSLDIAGISVHPTQSPNLIRDYHEILIFIEFMINTNLVHAQIT